AAGRGRGGRRPWWRALGRVARGAVGGVGRPGPSRGARPPSPPPAAEPAPPPPPRHVSLGSFAAPGWLAEGLPAMIAAVLEESPGLDLSGGGLRIDGAAAPAGDGWLIAVRVGGPDGGATLAAVRHAVAGAREVVGRVGALA